jgi:hypothetical protein
MDPRSEKEGSRPEPEMGDSRTSSEATTVTENGTVVALVSFPWFFSLADCPLPLTLVPSPFAFPFPEPFTSGDETDFKEYMSDRLVGRHT